MKNKEMKKVAASTVRIFKISNRRGYAALSRNNLTEGSTPLQAYQRMIKALKRSGGELPQITAAQAGKLVKVRV